MLHTIKCEWNTPSCMTNNYKNSDICKWHQSHKKCHSSDRLHLLYYDTMCLVHRSGIPGRTVCGIRLLAETVQSRTTGLNKPVPHWNWKLVKTVLDNLWRQSLFAMYWSIQRIRGFTMVRYINRLFTYLLHVHLSVMVKYYLILWHCLQHTLHIA